MVRFRVAAGVALLIACSGCSDDEVAEPIPGREEIDALLALSCTDPLDSVYEGTPPDPWTEDQRGKIVRCAYDRYITADEMSAHFPASGFPDPGIRTGAHKLRISYFTERLGQPVLTSGLMLIPSDRRGTPMPMLTVAHGSVGLGDNCALSKEHPLGFEKDWKNLAYTLAGDGWAMIMPDYPGLGTPGVTTWMYSEDEGHAVLDATRAMRDVMVSDALTPDTVLVGHSNGAHAVLSALSYLEDYGAAGGISEIILYNPFWLTNAAWGALAGEFGDALGTPTLLANSMMYFYGHLDAYEPGQAASAFRPEMQETAIEMLDQCWTEATSGPTGPEGRGIDIGADVYTADYVQIVGNDCAVNEMCDDPLAATWRERWALDRPPLNGSVPIVHWTGALDDFIFPGFQACGVDRMVAQDADVEVCVESVSSHSNVIPNSAPWVRQRLASVLLGESAPPACPGVETLGSDFSCGLPLPNSTDPADP